MEQSNLFRFSIDNALEIIIIFDAEGTVIYTNLAAEKKLEYKDELRGRLITDFLPGVFSNETTGIRFMGKSDGSFRNIMI